MKKIVNCLFVSFVCLLFSANNLVHAALIDNGDDTVTDTDTGLMWLKNADNGQADWAGAQQWANNLTFAGHSDWRIPSGVNSNDGQVCNSQPAGANCTETEFGSLYFGYGIYNLLTSGVFQSIITSSYWTSTEFPSDTSQAMAQDFNDGGQNPFNKLDQKYLWAVRDADPTEVPALIENADGTVTDTVQCLTWTKDANLPCTQNYGSGSWQGGCWFYSKNSAEEWADQLDYAGHQDWRLSAEVFFPGNSELEKLFYDILGNAPGGPVTNTGPFTNVLQSTDFTYYDGNLNLVTNQRVHDRYWILMAPVNPGREPSFNINDQTYGDHFMTDGESFSAWAVRDNCDIIPKVCNDGIDNDGDGLIDTNDPGCDDANDNDESGGLIDNGDGTITDPDVCLMWAKDANLAGGHLNFGEAQSFAANETLAGHTDWRLPDVLNFDGTGPCVTVGGVEGICSDSELGHLYYTELGNPAGGPLSNTGPFVNLTPVQYWTGTGSGPGWAYEFSFVVGSQNNAQASNDNRVLIVRDLVDPAIGCAIPGASQCSDGIDNDGDGLIDYPDDTGCCDANDATEGLRYLKGKFTRMIANAIPRDIGSYFQYKPVEAARFQTDFINVFLCRQLIQELEKELLPKPICFDGPISTGAPQECPPLDCFIDGLGCMDPYGFRRLTIPNEALHVFAQLVEGQLSDRDFDDRIKAMVAEGQITLDTREPAKKRYLPRISLTLGIFLGVVIIALFAFAYVSGRKRPD